MNQIRLEGAIDKILAERACNQLQARYPKMKSTVGECLQIHGLVSGQEVVSMISMISGLIGVMLAAWTKYENVE